MTASRPKPDPIASYLGRLAPTSRRTLAQALASIASVLTGKPDADPAKVAWHALDPKQLRDLRQRLVASHRPATVNKMQAALRGVLRAAQALGRLDDAKLQSLLAELPDEPLARREATERTLKPAEIRRLFSTAARDSSAAGRRDAALLALFLSSGLRRSEAAALELADYDARVGVLHIRSVERQKNREVQFAAPAQHAMAAWLDARGRKPGPLFTAVLKSGRVRGGQLTDQAIRDLIVNLAKRAGLPTTTTRDLRRTYIVALIASGLPLEEVQARVGHASFLTTAAYEQLARDAGPSAKGLLRLPYRRLDQNKKGGSR
jgi:integrase/recombinase XerD